MIHYAAHTTEATSIAKVNITSSCNLCIVNINAHINIDEDLCMYTTSTYIYIYIYFISLFQIEYTSYNISRGIKEKKGVPERKRERGRKKKKVRRARATE